MEDELREAVILARNCETERELINLYFQDKIDDELLKKRLAEIKSEDYVVRNVRFSDG